MPDDINKQLDNASGALDDATKAANEAVKAQEKLAGALSGTTNVIDAFEKTMSSLSSTLGDFKKNAKDTGKSAKSAAGDLAALDKEATSLADGLVKQGKASGDAADGLVKQGRVAKNASSGVESFNKKIAGSNKLVNLFSNSLGNGYSEANKFAGGIGDSATGLTAFGLAATFAADKLSAVVADTLNGAKNFAKFRIEIQQLAKQTILPGGVSQLKALNKQLGVTSENLGQFNDILVSGINKGILNVEQLASAGVKLREAFGGDQLGNLKQYVDLLNEIPTLSPKLNITASLDKDAANALALVEKGKVEAFINLQDAGLLGGVSSEKGGQRKEDVELLNNAVDTNKLVFDIKNQMSKYFPETGPQIAAVATGVSSMVKMLGGMSALFGGFQYFFGKNQRDTTHAVEDVESAVRRQGKRGRGRGKRGIGAGLSRARDAAKAGFGRGRGQGQGLVKSIQRGMTGALNSNKTSRGMLKGLTNLSKGARSGIGAGASKAVGFAKSGAGMGLIFTAVGMAADSLGDSMIASGDEISGGSTKIAGSIASIAGMTAGFAALGSVVPGVGTAIGAAAGFIIGTVSEMSSAIPNGLKAIGQGFQASENGIKRWNSTLQGFGSLVEGAGDGITSAFTAVGSGISSALDATGISATWEGMKDGADVLGDFFRDLGSSREWAAAAEAAENAADAQEKFASGMTKNWKLLDGEVAKRRELQKAQQESLLAYQKVSKGLDIALKSPVFALNKFKKELTGLDISNLQQLGGSSAALSDAVKQSAELTSQRFEEYNTVLAKARKDILTNGKLNASNRRLALQQLHEKELQAAEEFVKAMEGLVPQAANTFDKIKTEIERKIGEIEFGQLVGTGFDATEVAAENLNKAAKEFEIVSKNLAEFEKNQPAIKAKAAKNLEEQSKGAIDALGSAAKGGDAGAKKALESIKVDKAGKVVIDEKSLKKMIEGQEQAIERAEKKVKKDSDAIGGKDLLVLKDELMSALSAQAKAKAAKDDATGEGLFDLEETQEEIDSSTKAYKESSKAVAELSAKIKEITKQRGIKGAVGSEEFQRGAEKQSKEFRLVAQSKQDLEQKKGTLEQTKKVKTTKQVEEGSELIVLKQKLQIAGERDKTFKQYIAKEEDYYKSLKSGEIVGLQRRLDVLKSGQKLADVSGKSIQQEAKILAANRKLQMKNINIQGKYIKDKQAELKFLQQSLIENPDDPMLKKSVDTLRKNISNAQQEINTSFASLFDSKSFEALLADARKSMKFVSQELTKTLGEALMERAQFNAPSVGGAEKGRDLVISSLRKQYAFEIKSIGDVKKAREEDLKNQIAALQGAPDSEVNRAALEAKTQELENVGLEARSKVAQQEANLSRETLAAMDKIKSLRQEELSLEQEVVEAQEGFLSRIGANYGAVFDLQVKGLQLEQEKLNIAKEELASAVATGALQEGSIEYRRREQAIQLGGLKLQEKALAKQRNTFEQLLGQAFGQLRDIGARKGTQSQFRLLGLDDTRRKTRAGLFAGGEAGTLQERENKLVLGLSKSADNLADAAASKKAERFGKSGSYKVDKETKEESTVRPSVKADIVGKAVTVSGKGGGAAGDGTIRSVKADKDCCSKSLTVLESIRDILSGMKVLPRGGAKNAPKPADVVSDGASGLGDVAKRETSGKSSGANNKASANDNIKKGSLSEDEMLDKAIVDGLKTSIKKTYGKAKKDVASFRGAQKKTRDAGSDVEMQDAVVDKFKKELATANEKRDKVAASGTDEEYAAAEKEQEVAFSKFKKSRDSQDKMNRKLEKAKVEEADARMKASTSVFAFKQDKSHLAGKGVDWKSSSKEEVKGALKESLNKEGGKVPSAPAAAKREGATGMEIAAGIGFGMTPEQKQANMAQNDRNKMAAPEAVAGNVNPALAPPPAVAQGQSAEKGGGSDSIEVSSTVTGQMEVHFDNNMFKAKVVELLGTVEAKKKYKDIGLIASEGS